MIYILFTSASGEKGGLVNGADKEKKKTSPKMPSKYRGRDKTELVTEASRAKGSNPTKK